ncbi:undecaprenyldiphospho-muramoylpentapeptide beta-N-acetylglucosaminyltransferase [Yaniella flava]|uniref:UDP-N-acetylglucosamine--N-acetylmuramyl-(pentapeptide) pyrophosphoryl-undecaprenol N-acetylglucosamine transferase n=1 Tax=Yaniella flava TaxID=287930 RepID=A0ABN2UP75_9MICC
MNTSMNVVFTGGGTAGHVSPMLAMADAVTKQYRDTDIHADILMIGTNEGMEAQLIPDAGYSFATVPKVPMPRSLSRDLFAVPFRLRKAIKQARQLLREHQTQVVVGVGGYAATPVYLAARAEKIPVIVHEGNVRAGLANKLAARFAVVVACAFEGTDLPGAIHVGMPMRSEITELPVGPTMKSEARLSLGLAADKTTLVVTGGSSGAMNLNNAIAGALHELLETGAQILHLTGREKIVTDRQGNAIAKPGYTQVEYIDGLSRVYQTADLIVARSGAGTVHEIAAIGLPSVLVPLPIGNGEQEYNAAGLKEAGAAVVIPDDDFTSQWVASRLPELLRDQPRLEYMAQTAKNLGIDDAAETMATIITETKVAR